MSSGLSNIPPLLLLGSLGLFNWLVNIFAFHPEPGNVFDPQAIDPSIQEIFIDTSDGVALQAFLVSRSDSNRMLVFFHGNAGNASMRLPEALRLSHLQTNVLLVSYRGYGKSSGSPSESGVYLDGEAAMEYVQARLGFSFNRIIILGRSLGSAVAIEVAQHHGVAGLILVAPFSNGRDLADTMGLSWLAWLTGDPFDSVTKISRIKIPMLFIHGTEDRIVPLELGRKLFDATPSPKEWKSVLHADHNNLVQIAGPQYWEWIQEFIDRIVPRES